MVEDIYGLLGRRIREERKRLGLTLEQLASAAEISPGFLAYIEQDKKKASLATVEKVARGLGLSLPGLFQGASSSKPEEYRLALNLASMLRGASVRQRRMMYKVLRTLAKEG